MAKQKRQTSQAVKDAKRPANVARTAERKDARRQAQELRRQANVVRRHMGTLTPWESSRALRAEIRAARRLARRTGVSLAA